MENDESNRQSLYKDPAVANLLMELLKSKKKVEHANDSKQGYRYLDVEAVTGKDAFESKAILKKLNAAGILEEKVTDMVMYCPSCNSADVATNYLCPYCSSAQIIRNALIEHMTCGYIGTISVFKQEGDLICPKCKTKLDKDDYRSAGRWYECANCRRKIESPKINHVCRSCSARFSFDDAKYSEVYQYVLSDVAKNEIKSGALFSSVIKNYIKTTGNAETPNLLTGESGAKYQFDAILKSKEPGKFITIDYIFSSAPITQADIMKEYGKAFDTKTDLYVVAAKITEDAAKLARNIGVKTIVGDLSESLSQLATTLQPLIETSYEITQVPPPPPEEAPAPKKEKKTFKLFKKT